jgi:hypothetical protein
MKRLMLAIGLAAGLVLITLGALVTYHGLAVGLGRGIETGEYALLPPDREAVIAGVLMIAFGSISISVSLTSLMVFRGRNKPVDVIASSKEE